MLSFWRKRKQANASYEAKYSRINQVKFVEDSLEKFVVIVCLNKQNRFKFFKYFFP